MLFFLLKAFYLNQHLKNMGLFEKGLIILRKKILKVYTGISYLFHTE